MESHSMYPLSRFFQLAPLFWRPSVSLHVSTAPPLHGWVTVHRTGVLPSVYPAPVKGRLGCFQFGALEVQVFVQRWDFVHFGQIPKSGMAGLHARCTFNCLKNCQTVFPKQLLHAVTTTSGSKFQLLYVLASTGLVGLRVCGISLSF